MPPAPPLTFTDETTGQEVVIVGAALPTNGLNLGGQIRKTVNRYPGDEVSVQILGTEDDPVELEGSFDDRDMGAVGAAAELHEECMRLFRAGNLVRLEYDGDQLWGTFAYQGEKRGRWQYDYEIEFEPYYHESPLSFGGEPVQAPNDRGDRIRQQIDDLLEHTQNGPDEVDQNWLSSIVQRMLYAQDRVSRALSHLEGVNNYAELADDIASIAINMVRGAVRQVSSVATRTRRSSAEAISQAGPVELVVDDWKAEASRQARLTSRDLLKLWRDMERQTSPTGRIEHRVQAGQTLRSIADDYYDDPTKWVVIADANDLETDDIAAGDLLTIPALTQ